MSTDPDPQISKLQQALANLKSQERDFGLDFTSQKLRLQQRLTLLQQNIGMQLGDGAAVGGDASGRDKITADGHVIQAGAGANVNLESHPTTVNGPQTNIQGNVQGPVLSGRFDAPVNVGDIKVGDISGSTGVTIGHGASSIVNTGSGAVATGGGVAASGGGVAVGGNVHGGLTVNNAADAAQLFALLTQKVNALPAGTRKEDAQEAVKKLEVESKKDDQADESGVRRSLEFLVEVLPDAWDVTVATIINPLMGINTVFKKIAERVKMEREKKK